MNRPDGEGMATAMERNLGLLPIHQALTGALPWIPVMVLFTRGRFGLSGAVLLASLYYLFVVVIEVPSGWFSDRWGRAPTLRLAAAAWVVAHLCFLIGHDSFVAVATGQFFMAIGFASISGTDVAFHFDTLEALGRSDRYTDRQARLSAIGFAAAAIGAVFGGLLGLLDLRLAFAASLVLAFGQLGAASRLHEPPGGTDDADQGLAGQVATCLGYLRNRFLGWIFGYGVAMVTLEHVAFTLFQPWLTEALGRTADELGSTPVVSGVIVATSGVVGSVAARVIAPVSARVGTVASLLGLAVLSAVIVTSMALVVAAPLLILVAFRSAQTAAAPVLISAAVAPRVERRHRATVLSLNSLAGRLGYGSFLLIVSGLITEDPQRALRVFSVVSWTLVAALIATAWFAARPPRAAAIG